MSKQEITQQNTVPLHINGKLHHVPKDAGKTVASLLDHLLPALSKGPFGVAVNQTFVPQSLYTETTLHADDCLELMIPMEGG